MVHLLRVYDWYDQIEPFVAECTLGDGVLALSLYELDSGLYFLKSVTSEACETPSETIIEFMNEDICFDYCFTVGTTKEFSVEELRRVYRGIFERREEEFGKPKGDLKGNEVFDSYTFVKNINPVGKLQYGDIEIIPFNEYRTLSEAKMIDEFFKSKGEEFDYSSSLKGEYGAVIYVKNIYVKNDYLEAADFSLKRARVLVYLYSLYNRDNAQIIASVLKKLSTGLYWISINSKKDIYQGNLLRLGDWGSCIREQYQFLVNNDSNINVFLKLFNEAVRERDRMAAYYKYWTLLEVFAECEGVSGCEIRDWNDNVVLGKNGNV